MLLLIVFCLITWWRLSQLFLPGESLVYFIDKSHNPLYNQFWKHLANYDWSSIIFGKILEDTFGINLALYGWLEILFLIATVLIFYNLILVMTKRKDVSFAGGLILGSSYYGNWEMYAGGIYAWFMERVPLMLLLIPSLLFLHKFLETDRLKYFKLSLLLFSLGIHIAHWGAMFAIPFVLYPIFWKLIKKVKRPFSQYLICSFLYTFIAVFFVAIQAMIYPGLGPTWSGLDFLLHPFVYNYPANMLRQLIYWTTYFPFFSVIKNGFQTSPIALFVTAEKSLQYTIPITLIYIFSWIVIYIRLKNFRALLFTLTFGIFSLFFFNAYLGQYQVPSQAGPNRYLYLPTYLLSIFWALFIWAFFWTKKNLIFKVGGYVFLGLIFLMNYWLISEHFEWIWETHTISKSIWYKATDTAVSMSEGGLILLPSQYSSLYQIEFLTDQFKNQRIKFINDPMNLPQEKSDIIHEISYDKTCKCAISKKL